MHEDSNGTLAPMSTNSDYWRKQCVLVTGSSRGLGRELAVHFSKLGAHVAVNFLKNESAAHDTLSLCAGRDTKVYQADVGNEDSVQQMVKRIDAELGPISILINNAGHTRDGLLIQMSSEQWRSVLNTHLDGAFYCSREVLKNMMNAKFGRIINVSSVAGVRGTMGQCNYSAAKAGLIGFTKALSKEIGTMNITCNAVVLGMIDTELTARLTDEAKKQKIDRTALRRMGSKSEVAGLIEYLAGPHSSFITGAALNVDGGAI